MFSQQSALQAQQEELGGIVTGKYARGLTPYPLKFQLDLGATVNGQAMAWRFLPGHYTRDWFVADCDLLMATNSGATTWTYAAHHNHEALWAWPGSYTYRTYEDQTLFFLPTGVTVGILGGWITGDSGVLNINHAGATMYQGLPDYKSVCRPFEYNGHLFFSAYARNPQNGETIIPVVGYIEPHLFKEDELFATGTPDPLPQFMVGQVNDRWNTEHFSIEHLGYGATVGLYQGDLVVVTSQGVWNIKGLGEGGYGLGEQVSAWNMDQGVQIAISHGAIAALSNGNLYVVTPTDRTMYPNTRFTTVGGNPASLVLSGGGDVAVMQGTSWMSFRNRTAVGTLVRDLVDVNTWYYPEPTAVSLAIPQTTLLTTMTVEFDAPMNVVELTLDDKVVRAVAYTDRRAVQLRQSSFNTMQWRGGFTATSLTLELEVPVNERIVPPILYLKPRSRT